MVPYRYLFQIPAACCMAALALFMVMFPENALIAAARGISVWWDVLFPALFPFFVLSEMMLGIGVVHFFGTLLDPMMRPLFRVPGIGGFVMAMGFASGYPVGARLTSRLWDQRLIDRYEGERLVAFTTTADPIFLIGAVCVGFFHDVTLAFIFAVTHYGAAVLVGLVMRFYGPARPEGESRKIGLFILRRALAAMHRARVEDGRTLGVMFKQAVQSGLKMIMVVGGLVVFFSVILELLAHVHLLAYLSRAAGAFLHMLGINAALSESAVNGLFEVTLGAKAAAQAGVGVPIAAKVAVAAFVLSWGGLSVHAQIVSLLHHTNLRYAPFAASRLLHGLFSAMLAAVLWNPMQQFRPDAHVPTFFEVRPSFAESLMYGLPYGLLVFGLTLLLIVVCYAVYVSGRWLIRRFR